MGDAQSVMFYEELKLWEVNLYVFYEVLRLWEVHLYVFYVSGGTRGVGCPTSLSGPVTLGWSAKERPSRAWRGGEGGEARSVVFGEGLRLWEAHLYVFYVSGRLSGLTE